MQVRRQPLVITIRGRRYRWRGIFRRPSPAPATATGKVIWLAAYRRRATTPEPEGAA